MLELGLTGKVAIVTGGSEGLGRAAAEKLAREGVRVAICARRKDLLERAADEIRKASGGQVLALPTDVRKGDEVQRFVDAIVAQWGGVDILVNNAGTSAASGFENVNDQAWQDDIDEDASSLFIFSDQSVSPDFERIAESPKYPVPSGQFSCGQL